jgi:TP901 family phage tail tape measure protein
MADRNLVLQLLISAKDEASSVFSTLYSFIDRTTSATANRIRDAFAGVFGGGLRGAADFEAQMDRVAAKGGYTVDAMGELATQARAVGAAFGVSGVESGTALEALAAAGLDAKSAIGALPPVLALAASEQISTEVAATKLIDSLSIMGLGFEETGRVADVFAKGANITTSSASQLAEALTQAGGMARAAGMDLESTVAALDLLHKNGIKGAEAGTALKAILTSLLDPASKAGGELDALGISSRDLGTVMGALKDKGNSANAAILAFGTEAGPGLRALIAEGQTGLNDYTLQLKNAGGAAQEAADAMGGNLKSAMASLNSAWEALKSALLEPLLDPIAKQAKELAAAFSTALSDGSIKGVQDLLREFGTGIADGIASAIKSFDFESAKQAVNGFAEYAKGSFAIVSSTATAVAGTIKTVFNATTAPINALVAGFSITVSKFFDVLASIERAASNIGLGTAKRADELLAKADAARAAAEDLWKQAKQDLKDIEEGGKKVAGAFDGIGDKIKKAREEAEKVKPPDFGDAKVLEPIVFSLQDYTGKLAMLKKEQADAADAADEAQHSYLAIGQLYDQGAVSLYVYEEAKRKDKIAQDALKQSVEATAQAQRDYDVAVQEAIRGINTESTAATASVKTKQQIIAELGTAVTQTGKYVTALEGTAKAQLSSKDAEIALAKAKGMTYEAQRLSIERAQLEADWSVKIAKAKLAEQQAEQALAVAKRDQLKATNDTTEAGKAALKIAELLVEKEKAATEAAKTNVEAQKILAEKVQVTAMEKQAAALASDRQTASEEKLTEAVKKEADVFDLVAQNAYKFSNLQANVALRNSQVGTSAATATKSMNDLNVTYAKFNDVAATAFGTEGLFQFGRIISDIERAISDANTMAQRLATEGLSNATFNAEALALALENSQSYLNDAAHGAAQNLRQAMADARQEAERLSASLLDMAESFNREMLQIQGDKQRLLELDHAENLKRIEELHAKAGAMSNDEYQLAVRRANDLYALKLKQLAEEEAQQAQATNRSTTAGTAARAIWGEAADEVGRFHGALKQAASIDLDRLSGQLTTITRTAGQLRETL